MPKILFVALHRPNRSPSQRFRYEQYLEVLRQNGWECAFSYLIPEKYDRRFYANGHYLIKLWVLLLSYVKRWRDVLRSNQFDVIFVQREAMMIRTTFFERRFAKSKAKLVFDFDDAIWLPNVSEGNQNLRWLKSAQKTKKIIACSDLVLAGNQYLYNYASQFQNNVRVLPTTIDTAYHVPLLKEKESNARICIGWTGSITTIQHFEQALPFLSAIVAKYKERVKVRVIGSPAYRHKALNIEGVAWRAETEIKDLQEFDIGIMPLSNDEWAKGKCGLKGLQYMALGIPCIMSPVGVNVQIVEHGKNGFLANTTAEWIDICSSLIDNEAERRKIGKAARERVESAYSVKANQGLYLKYLNELL
jgi:glycosyltransferase involved in cell wall biosynthesis